MLSRPVTLLTAVVLAVALTGCGVQSDDRVTENVLTAELVVPPVDQEIVERPTATSIPPTTTPTPPEPTSGTPQADETEQKSNVSVPNRGYNAMGGNDAPITMFDFSDFL